eukprot:3569865-Prymnesium_polylepis.3
MPTLPMLRGVASPGSRVSSSTLVRCCVKRSISDSEPLSSCSRWRTCSGVVARVVSSEVAACAS